MSSAPVRGNLPHNLVKNHHHHHHKKHDKRHRHHRHDKKKSKDTPEEKRPKVNPIFLWAAQCDQTIVEVRCEDYDKRNRIVLTKTAHGWRSIPKISSDLPISSKIEEKENSKSIESTETDISEKIKCVSNKEKHLRKLKKKKCFELSKSRKRQCESEPEELIWKTGKRKKLVGIIRKRIRLSLDENLCNVKIKKESKKIRKHKFELNTKNITNNIQAEKFSDPDKSPNNQHLQPRVLLEQLHMSQMPSKISRTSDIINEPLLYSNINNNCESEKLIDKEISFNKNQLNDTDVDSNNEKSNLLKLNEHFLPANLFFFLFSKKKTACNLTLQTSF